MWQGYFVYDSNEIINVARVQAYASDLSWFTAIFNADDFETMLGEGPYTDPATDFAPWYDPDVPASTDFCGLYPLDVSGIDDSKRSSQTFEAIRNGGVPGRVREGMRSVVFNTAIIARSEAGAEYGMTWLRRILLGGWCSDDLTTDQSQGLPLAFLTAEPKYTDESVAGYIALQPYWRNLYGVAFNAGPTRTSANTLSCGGAVWTATFTATVGNPYLWGDAKIMLNSYMTTGVTDPWGPDITPGTADSSSHDFVEVTCEERVWQPIYDPLCPALVAPPVPPSVPLACYTPPSTWKRRKVTLPDANFFDYSAMVPELRLYAGLGEVRNVRVRWYRDPDLDFDPDVTPCNWDAECVISYIPEGGTFYFDAVNQKAEVLTMAGHRRRSDSLCFANDGTPIIWPELRCGQQYVMTVDYDNASTRPSFTMLMHPRY